MVPKNREPKWCRDERLWWVGVPEGKTNVLCIAYFRQEIVYVVGNNCLGMQETLCHCDIVISLTRIACRVVKRKVREK